MSLMVSATIANAGPAMDGLTGASGELRSTAPLIKAPEIPAPKAVPVALSADKENDESIHVGDEVLVFNGDYGIGLVGKVKKLFANNTAIVDFSRGYGKLAVTLNNTVSKSVKSKGGLSVGDHVIDAYNQPGKVKKLFTNGQALVNYGAVHTEDFRDIKSLSKQIE